MVRVPWSRSTHYDDEWRNRNSTRRPEKNLASSVLAMPSHQALIARVIPQADNTLERFDR